MSMTRKDFEAIAATLRELPVDADGNVSRNVVIEQLAKTLSAGSGYDRNGNRRFDTDRFLAAAGRWNQR